MNLLKRKADVSDTGDQESPVVLDSGVQVADEYAEDSSDEEDVENTIGDVPLRWYDEFDHVGYTRHGERIARGAQRGEIERFLERVQNPEFWRTVVEKSSGRERVLSEEDLELVERVSGGRFPLASSQTEPTWLDFFSGQVMQMPLSGRPEHKRSFLPSRSEALQVSALVGKMKRGLISMDLQQQKQPEQPRFYMLWKEDGTTDEMRRLIRPQRAPKPALPGHELSYRPPPEYIPLEGEGQEDRVTPKSHRNLRSVPAYPALVSEQFERCLSLYLCPRKTVLKTQLRGPEELLPPLPDRRDLQPYPTRCALVFRGHRNAVRALSVSVDGQLLASASDDGSVRVWEISSGRCLLTCQLSEDTSVTAVAWNPSPRLRLLAASCGRHVYFLAVETGDTAACANTRALLARRPPESAPHARRYDCRWRLEKDAGRRDAGVCVALSLVGTCRQMEWHAAGDYLVTVVPDAGNTSVMVHQLSRWRSQMPFSKSQRAQAARFHPLRPYLFIATQNHVRVFNLARQQLSRKLSSGVKWVSSLAVHPAGDNVVIGSYDHRVHWFDLDLSSSPCHRLRYHGLAVRQVCFHQRYPLMSSAGDDNKIMVFHAKVSSDLNQQAQVLPVKMLRGHDKCEELCVLDVVFHPEQPWLFSAGADATIRLWV